MATLAYLHGQEGAAAPLYYGRYFLLKFLHMGPHRPVVVVMAMAIRRRMSRVVAAISIFRIVLSPMGPSLALVVSWFRGCALAG